MHQILATQLADSMMYPVSKFLQADMEGIIFLAQLSQRQRYLHSRYMVTKSYKLQIFFGQGTPSPPSTWNRDGSRLQIIARKYTLMTTKYVPDESLQILKIPEKLVMDPDCRLLLGDEPPPAHQKKSVRFRVRATSGNAPLNESWIQGQSNTGQCKPPSKKKEKLASGL